MEYNKGEEGRGVMRTREKRSYESRSRKGKRRDWMIRRERKKEEGGGGGEEKRGAMRN